MVQNTFGYCEAQAFWLSARLARPIREAREKGFQVTGLYKVIIVTASEN
jgi:hypothetical protein